MARRVVRAALGSAFELGQPALEPGDVLLDLFELASQCSLIELGFDRGETRFNRGHALLECVNARFDSGQTQPQRRNLGLDPIQSFFDRIEAREHLVAEWSDFYANRLAHIGHHHFPMKLRQNL